MTSRERRQYRRHSLHHGVLVVARGLNPVAGALGNICESGMWLEQVTSLALAEFLQAQKDAVVEVHLFIKRSGLEQHHRVMATVRRIDGSNLGLEFLEPNPDLLRLLITTGSYDGKAAVTHKNRRQQLWRLVRQHSQSLVQALLETFSEYGLHSIEQRLGSATLLAEIHQLNDGKQLLVRQRTSLSKMFNHRLNLSIAELENNEAISGAQGGLGVLDKGVFEDWLTLQAVAKSVGDRNKNVLFKLNQALSQITQRDLTNRTNPLGPTELCHSLQSAIFDSGFGALTRPALYEAFESSLYDHWLRSIEALLQRLSDAGLRVLGMENLPLNWPSVTQAPVKAKASRELSCEESPDPVLETGAAEVRPAEPERADRKRLASGSVLRLVGLQRDPTSTDAHNAQPPSEAIRQLHTLKAELRRVLSEPASSLQAAIANAAEQNGSLKAAMNQEAMDRAGLVDKIFAPLASQTKLPDNIREHLNQLRVPVLQVLLETPAFLDEEDHPAREIINNLMRLSLADRSSNKVLERTVSDIVTQLLDAEHLDDDLFQQVGRRLVTLIERQDQSFGRNAERISKTLEGQQRLKETRQAVKNRLDVRLSGRNVPVVLLELLHAGWEQLLVLAILKEGADSLMFTERFAVVDQIQAWLGQEAGHEDIAFERELESSALLRLVERELAGLGDSSRWLDVVKNLKGQLVDEIRPDREWVEAYPPGEQAPAAPESYHPENSRWVERVHQLQVGDWILVRDGDDEAQRMRLVWGGEDVYRFVFLTGQGMHEVEYDLAGLIKRFEVGDIQRVDQNQVPFVDQSLFDIVQDVYREMAIKATQDPLTGCLQRHGFEKQFAWMVSQSKPDQADGALIALDIDQFSIVNASYGTAAGDAMLQKLGAMLADLQPRGDESYLLGRLSGNEFAVAILPMAHEDGLDFAERLRRQFKQQQFHYQNAEFYSSLSVSVNTFDDASPEPGELLNQSNLALKSAKKAGGDRVEVVGVGQQQSRQAISWVSRIDSVLESGALSLRAQRIVPVSDTGPAYYEILLGLQDNEGNTISPQAFIEAAEQFRRSTRIDRWVLDNAFDWMQANPDIVASVGGFNINLSGASLSDDAFLSYLEDTVRGGRVPANKLCFEITETAAVANLHYAADFLQEMKRTGCQFALDDFGTGLASYAYLQRLPVDFLKIDGVFVKDLNDNLSNYAMVRSINELSHFLGIKTIAEYVEDLEILEALREMNVDYAQGFGLAKPRPLNSIKAEPATKF
ncbi:DUF1631 family protein [Marinobacter caseinilyticus]|uniref:DUF1631 family protein n=1 Tax=Marinobacter caseinilyticus TaxID=2692195 RepID=UPI00140CF87A|nr:DUF1631 family protein [Marinobacter caseinilyticus]